MRAILAVICTALVAACATEPPLQPDAAGRPPLARVANVPFHPQAGFQCGPAAMAAVMAAAGVRVSPSDLEPHFRQAPDPRAALIASAHRYGRFAYPIAGVDAMMTELAAGHPVLVLQNLGIDRQPMWNCVVATGYDRAAGEVILNSGAEQDKHMSVRLFQRLWSDAAEWGLVVLRPGDLPASAEREPYLRAADALERSGRHWEAVLAYDGALSRWPTDAAALMGLGSSLYLLGDPQGAADAYRAASTLADDPAPALDRLATVLAELGRREEAAAATSKAVPQKARLEHKGKDVVD